MCERVLQDSLVRYGTQIMSRQCVSCLLWRVLCDVRAAFKRKRKCRHAFFLLWYVEPAVYLHLQSCPADICGVYFSLELALLH